MTTETEEPYSISEHSNKILQVINAILEIDNPTTGTIAKHVDLSLLTVKKHLAVIRMPWPKGFGIETEYKKGKGYSIKCFGVLNEEAVIAANKLIIKKE
jgi:hypothetical protein